MSKSLSKSRREPIPVNIISGPLGVGKTTMINHVLQSRPQGERWAVLVNEYGLVGIDAAFMGESSGERSSGASASDREKGVEIREVAGGCICCSAGMVFEVSLVRLLQRRPDRLLIEPTGLAALSGILDTLGREGIREAVDVRSIICLLDVERLREDMRREEVVDQIEAADVLIASRADLASERQLNLFETWAKSFFPPKRWVGQVERGRLPAGSLDLISERTDEPRRGGHQHGTDHHHPHHDHAHHHHSHEHHDHEHHDHEHHDHKHQHDSAETPHSHQLEADASRPIISRAHRSPHNSTIGWVCWERLQFDAQRALTWLQSLNRLPSVRRVKAVLHTNEGWWRFNYIGEVEEQWPSGYRRDSRLEVIFEGEHSLEIQELERALRACLISDVVEMTEDEL